MSKPEIGDDELEPNDHEKEILWPAIRKIWKRYTKTRKFDHNEVYLKEALEKALVVYDQRETEKQRLADEEPRKSVRNP